MILFVPKVIIISFIAFFNSICTPCADPQFLSIVIKEELIAEYNNQVQICLLVEDAARHRYCCEECPHYDPTIDWDEMDSDWYGAYVKIQDVAAKLCELDVDGYGFTSIFRKNPFAMPPTVQKLR